MSNFTNCIISYIDLIDVKRRLKENSKEAVKLMRETHSIVWKTCRPFSHHSEICFWNDSVLLYAPLVSSNEGHFEVMTEVQLLKRAIAAKSSSYAICVQGKSFPHPGDINNAPNHLHFLKASSLAFSNCFKIEKELGSRFKKNWYIDFRIKSRIQIDAIPKKARVHMWPTMKWRTVFMYDDNICFTARRA